MARREDPEGTQLQTVLKHASFEGKETLEVGCGDGRLTFEFADLAKSVVALDPIAGDVRKAMESTPNELTAKVSFLVGTGEHLPFPDESYDVVFFTWSLCCMGSEAHMREALNEAWRVLRPEGLFLNLQPSLHQPFHWGEITYLVTKNPEDLVGEDIKTDDFDSRFVLKHTALIEGKFGLIAEEVFTGNTYYDTVEEVLEAVAKDRQVRRRGGKIEYDGIDEETKREIRRRLRSRHTPEGVRTQESAVITVLRKLQPD